MPQGIPGTGGTRPVFDLDLEIGVEHDLGRTPFGHRRELVVSGGTLDGEDVRGRVHGRGLEYELTLDNGVVELEQIHVIDLGDEQVFMHSCGVAPYSVGEARMVLDFEAPSSGAHAFLNDRKYVATRRYDPALKLLRLSVYEVSAAPSSAPGLRVTRPVGAPGQAWECPSGGPTGKRSELYSATVELASFVSVGDSKRGARNIAPITSGWMAGKLNGRVLPGGADYQLFGDTISLDARYLLETDDGELILVRNCGQFGALFPTFETRMDGPHASLNTGYYVSSDPEPSADLTQVKLAIYEAH